MSETTEFRIVRGEKDLQDIKSSWDTLLKTSPTSVIFLSYDWLMTWWEAHGKNKEMYVIIAQQGEQIVGIAPLMKIKRIGGTQLQFIGTPLIDYADFIYSDASIIPEIFLFLFLQKDWKSIALLEIPESSPTLQHVPKRLLVSEIFCNECMKVVFKDINIQELQQYLKKREIMRRVRVFEREGKICFKKAMTLDEAHFLLEKLFQQHITQWKNKNIRSIFLDHENQSFSKHLLTRLFPDHMEIYGLYFNDEPIAVLQGFFFSGVFTGYFQSYNMDFAKKGPGIIGFKMLLEYFITDRDDIKVIDFSRGTEQYKNRFSSTVEVNKGILISRSPLGYMISKIGHTIKEKIMRNPQLHEKISGYRNKLLSIFWKN